MTSFGYPAHRDEPPAALSGVVGVSQVHSHFDMDPLRGVLIC
jgi:hypothetical protein